MHRRDFLATAAAVGSAAPLLGLSGFAAATEAPRFSGPYTHANLALYFAHGPSAAGPVPLTLSEALAKNQVFVHETGDVNRLVIENRGDQEVFVQAGEIVKGGKQDRVLTVSLLLPKRSGPMPIAAYCVEHGRWQQRGKEEVSRFSSSDSAVPSRKAKIAMQAPPADGQYRADTGRRQSEVWKDVDETQRKLAGTVGAPVNAPESRSSLQLSLENKRVRETVAAYVTALEAAIEKSPDSIGLVFAINGAINSADLYPSHGLFVKLWPKLLNAAATEAVAEKNGKDGSPPAVADIVAFVDRAEKGRAGERRIDADTKLATRETEKTYYFETRRGDAVIHRNYLAR
jgi:ARG/rhodanese/phosphatase superfamily protein